MEIIRLATFNCKNVKISVDEIRELCCQCDIILLQETWLTEQELPILSQISNDFYYKGVSAMDTRTGLISGRPFGGVAILWRKSLGPAVKPVTYGDNRLLGLEVMTHQGKLLIINVYLPCSSVENEDEFLYYLSRIDSIICSSGTSHCAVIGDFNADLKDSTDVNTLQLFGRKLKSFCSSEGFIISDYEQLPHTSSTYVSLSHGTTSWLDHIVSTHSMNVIIGDIKVDNKYVTSDHCPLLATIYLNAAHVDVEEDEYIVQKRIKWDSLNADDLDKYKTLTQRNLGNIHLNREMLLCDNTNCKEASHIADLDTLYNDITAALIKAAEELGELKETGKNNQLQGWNIYCKELHAVARDAFLAWRNVNSPRTGAAFTLMSQTRAQFKRALRRCKANDDQKTADALAMKMLHRNDKDFWKMIKSINHSNIKTQAATINGTTGKQEICDMWKVHYEELLNSARDTSKQGEVESRLNDIDADERCRVSPGDVHKAITQLKAGKSAGMDGLMSEHLTKASPQIAVLLSLVFNCMLSHGHLPDELMNTCIISIVKDKKGNLSDKDNYRPIALTNVISKVLELYILDRYSSYFNTGCNQFGFKKDHATDLCVFILKEVVNFYHLYSSPVYAAMLDSSKAFDRVNHFHLFDKLLKRNVPKLIVRLLLKWYRSQSLLVRWENMISGSFKVSNGVRQGGVLSPVLFNVFIEELSRKLMSMKVGCFINNVCFNHLAYADDAVILAPSPAALQELINVCEQFASENDMVYNVSKSRCIAFIPSCYKNINIPKLFLGNSPLVWVSSHKYLGAMLTSDLTDDCDIERQLHATYVRGNVLVHKFRNCCENVKLKLFQSYCSSFYMSHLWCNNKRKTKDKLKVAYNNVFRKLMCISRETSISGVFVLKNIDGFSVLLRRYTYSFYKRIMASDNLLIRTISSSLYFTFCSKWFTMLNSSLFIH